jgi:putative endonuclease
MATGPSASPLPTAQHLVLGRIGERAAEAAYVRRGYRVVARNWRSHVGELDLVFARGALVVICEVKTRRSRIFGEPWQAVDARKQAKLRNVAQAFLIASGLRPEVVRFDVASVTVAGAVDDGEPDAMVSVFEDAF